ncbi:hypothetical protein E2C01_041062 [Portunus trituberculatus]|uniref:Uncharacterized protein n=1 Tax=Portunus trituberculatus TaxID=210409 RepID=A0A5B7FPX9_PORTR|nr:hypothetical protein [Portunus trituberculatus]
MSVVSAHIRKDNKRPQRSASGCREVPLRASPGGALSLCPTARDSKFLISIMTGNTLTVTEVVNIFINKKQKIVDH